MASSLPGSVEYNTLIASITRLTTAFESSPISVAGKLLSNGFISPEVYDKVTEMTPVLGDDMKAANRLVKSVIDQVSMCPERFYDFMAMPLFKEPWMSSVYDAITNDYSKKFKLVCVRWLIVITESFNNLEMMKAVSNQKRQEVPLGTSFVDDIDEHSFKKSIGKSSFLVYTIHINVMPMAVIKSFLSLIL